MSPTGTQLAETVPDRYPRVWTLWKAARPSQVGLVCLVYALGLGMAVGSGGAAGASDPFDPDSVTAAGTGLLVLVPATAAIHYANEYADYETDRLTTPTPFSGGSGALHRTGLDRGFLRRATGAALLVGVVAALAVAGTVGFPVDAAAILVVGTGLGLGYSLPPVALVRRGGGEVVNALLGGFLLPQYGVAVVGTPTPETGLAVAPFTLVVGCNLLATHWPDREADAAVGKRTVAVRWSPGRLRITYAGLAAAAAVLLIPLIDGTIPTLVALAHLPALPFLAWGGDDTTRHRERLADIDAAAITALSNRRMAALAFWLNVYNAAAQDSLAADPERYESRWRFFREELVTVAGESLSLDDVEHGILRGSRSKYGFGYLPRLASSRFQRQAGLQTVDPRVHFALNCGAASCPAIRAYEAAQVDEQLATATAAYLDRTVEYDPDEGLVRVPRVCLWFYRDFGREAGILRLLREHGVVPSGETPRLRFRSFDWSFDARRFPDE